MSAAEVLLYGADHIGNEFSKIRTLWDQRRMCFGPLVELLIFTVSRFTFVRSRAG
jgi:hypothetical protein